MAGPSATALLRAPMLTLQTFTLGERYKTRYKTPTFHLKFANDFNMQRHYRRNPLDRTNFRLVAAAARVSLSCVLILLIR
jgi:hypothetical protein